MGTISTATMTFEEFEQLPDEPGKLELLRGVVIREPPPRRPHNEKSFHLARLLADAVDTARASGAQTGEVWHEMGYLMSSGPSWLQPDVAVNFPNQPGDHYFEGSPMLVFEIVSPNDKAIELQDKVMEFLARGALEVWVIYPDPDLRYAWIYDSSKRIRREDHAIRGPHLPGIEIPFDRFL